MQCVPANRTLAHVCGAPHRSNGALKRVSGLTKACKCSHSPLFITTEVPNHGAMRERKLGSHTPPCHRRMVITTLFSVLLAALQRRPVLYHTRWLLAVHWHCSSGHRGQLAPTTHPQCRLVSNPCPAGREVVSNSILRGAMAPWLAQWNLRISACAPSVRQLNKSLLLCVWRIPRLLPTLHAHAAHTFMPTCFRLPHMGRTLAAPVVLWLCNT